MASLLKKTSPNKRPFKGGSRNSLEQTNTQPRPDDLAEALEERPVTTPQPLAKFHSQSSKTNNLVLSQKEIKYKGGLGKHRQSLLVKQASDSRVTPQKRGMQRQTSQADLNAKQREFRRQHMTRLCVTIH
jgi:hypothetical protein